MDEASRTGCRHFAEINLAPVTATAEQLTCYVEADGNAHLGNTLESVRIYVRDRVRPNICIRIAPPASPMGSDWV